MRWKRGFCFEIQGFLGFIVRLGFGKSGSTLCTETSIFHLLAEEEVSFPEVIVVLSTKLFTQNLFNPKSQHPDMLLPTSNAQQLCLHRIMYSFFSFTQALRECLLFHVQDVDHF